jgi:hypothetical protein
MRLKPTLLAFCVALTAVMGLSASNVRHIGPTHNIDGREHRSAATSAITSPLMPSQKIIPPIPDTHLESGPFIDGARTPENILDTVAYAQFFRMLRSSEASPDGQLRQRSYIKHVLRSADRAPTDVEVEAILRFVRSYQQRLDDFDKQQTARSDETRLAREIASTMRTYMSRELAFSLDWYIKTRFKRTIKIIFSAAP